MPNYSAEVTYSAVYITKAALEKSRSLGTDKVLDALKGMRIETPAGVRVYREQDHQFVYAVPAGRVIHDPRYPIPVVGDLKIVDPKDYYRWPPFKPLDLSK
jgi:hypothetical protein